MSIRTAVFLLICSLTLLRLQTLRAQAEERKPCEFDLPGIIEEVGIERPARSGIQIRTTNAEVLEREGKKVLQAIWEIKYSGDRWPLSILEPSLSRETSGQTKLLILAKGKSGEGYGWSVSSPKPFAGQGYRSYPKLDWFLEIGMEQGTAKGIIETDFDSIKAAFLKHLPKEFSVDITPDLYLRLTHTPDDRAEYLHLDAWTGDVDSPPRKIIIRKW